MSAKGLSQNTKTNDSTTISNRALDLMIKDLRKGESVRVALKEKDSLVLELVDSNLKMFNQFVLEREKKVKAQETADAAKRKLDKFDRKRFGVGVSLGATLNSNFEVKPAFLIGVNYSIFRF